MSSVFPTSLGEVNLRTAVPGDLTAYRELRLEALKNHPSAFGADYEENLTRPETYWQSRMQIDDAMDALFLAEQGSNLIGMTGIHRSSGRKDRHAAIVWGVYVREAWRGLRIADELIHLCLGWGSAHGVVIARLGVATSNTPAIRCYERCGFSIYGTERKSIFHDGVYYDEYLMDCLLNSMSL